MFPDRRLRALSSLRGLAVGDALGSQFFVHTNRNHLTRRTVPPGPWQWTDDTEMACSVFHVLDQHGHVDVDALAASFARRHDFDRGYGSAANRMLRLVREGGDWRKLAAGLFDGQGSYGNGAAMRVAPLGAWYADDLEAVVAEATLSAQVTHTHPEAVAGAIAVAVAAALLAIGAHPTDPADFLAKLAGYTPPSAVRSGIETARDLPGGTSSRQAGVVLGNGSAVSAPDTVPFALWVVAYHHGGFPEAFWTTASAGGDVDTTCAIVGGVLAARTGVERPPVEWAHATEDLPPWIGARLWPLTAPKAIAAPARRYTDRDWERIQAGYTAQEMEEKWHLRVADDWLYAHRSWTGFGIFAARFARDNNGWLVAELLVERNPAIYRSTDDAADTTRLEQLIDSWLLDVRHAPGGVR